MKRRYEYQKMAAELRSQILAGRFQPGQKLPGERDLCEILGGSRITVRLALNVLDKEQLVVRRHGSGTYVSNRPKSSIPLGIDYGGSVLEHAPDLIREVLEFFRGPVAEDELATEHFPAQTNVMQAVRVDKAGRSALAWDKCFIVAEFATRLQKEDLEEVDFLHRWMKVQRFRINHFTQRVAAVAAGARDETLLGIRRGKPVLGTLETYYSDHATIAGAFVSHYHPDKITLQTRFEWKPRSTRSNPKT